MVLKFIKTENMSQRLFGHLFLALLLVALTATVQSAPSFPGQTPDKRLLKAQEKADQLFERGEYERAMMIYRNDLAPVGDKYAQYMVGYLYLTGNGVPEDTILASVWYRLAAERNDESFAQARDSLLAVFKEEHKRLSDLIYADLRREMGDVTIVSKLIDDDLAILGQHVRNDPNYQLSPLGTTTFGRKVEVSPRFLRRLESRMNFLIDIANAGDGVSDEEIMRIDSLERQVREVLDSAK